MKLTKVLFRWKKALPGGHLWRGKYRLYREVTPLIAAKKRLEFELEEKNMFYLRHPYLTLEQAESQTLPMTVEEEDKIREEMKYLEWKDHKSLGDRFGFLKVQDKWE